MWVAARSINMADFTKCIDEIKEKNEKTYEWLFERPIQEWFRSHFSTIPKWDMLFNNLCEFFNKYILEARDKPILTMCETIRCKLMNRFFLKRNVMDKYNGLICPRIQKKLKKNKEMFGRYWPQPFT